MNEIAELEQRITSALKRIDAAFEAGAPEDHSQELAELRAALEAEKETNSQLEDRLTELHETQKTALGSLEEWVQRLRDQLGDQESDMRRLREVNAQLRDINAKLREANAAGLADAGLINAAVKGELDALRATQMSDRSELDAIIGELRPMIEESA